MKWPAEFFLFLALSACFSACKNSGNDRVNGIVLPAVSADTASISLMIKKAGSFGQTNLDSMHFYAQQALNDAIGASFTEGEARAMGIEASYQRRKGNYVEAISIGLRVIKMYDQLGLWQAEVTLQNMLADTYKEMGGEKGTLGFLQKGIELSRQAQALAEKKNYTEGIVLSLNQQGIILRDMSKRSGRADYMDSALQLYKEGIRIVSESGKGEELLGKLYNNISQVYNERYKDFATSLDYLFKAVAFNSARNNVMSITYNYGNISDVYATVGDFSKARTYARAMLVLSEELKAPHRKVNAYRQLTRVARLERQYDSALYFNDFASAIADSLANVEKTAQIADMQVRYETTKKETRINELSDLNIIKSQRLWVLASAALLMVFLVVMFVLQNRRLKKQKEENAVQAERLRLMMKELHHRVKNNLQIVSSLLNLQTYRLKDEESISAIRESQLRVQAMSLMHQRLYQVEDVSMVNFKLYIDDLVESLMRAYGYGADDFDLRIMVEQDLLDVDTVMPMGLLVNEIITNSFKYAYKDVERPLLTIRLEVRDTRLNLDIADNGPGNDGGKAGFGKKLITALTQQLKATCHIDTSEGTRYSFNIPYNKEKAA